MLRFTFSKHERLCGENCIKAVFKNGSRFAYNGVSMFVLPNNLSYNRFLCTFRRGFGSAVERNRVRRISKEVYRQIKNCLKTGFDIVLIVFSAKGDFFALETQFCNLLRKAELLETVANEEVL